MEIESLKKVRLEDGDVLLVEVDIGALSAHHAKSFLEQVRHGIREVLGPVKCLIMPMHRTRVSVINVEDALIKEEIEKRALTQKL